MAQDMLTFLLVFVASPLYLYSPYLRGLLVRVRAIQQCHCRFMCVTYVFCRVQALELFVPRRGQTPWRGDSRNVGYSFAPPKPTPPPFYQVGAA